MAENEESAQRWRPRTRMQRGVTQLIVLAHLCFPVLNIPHSFPRHLYPGRNSDNGGEQQRQLLLGNRHGEGIPYKVRRAAQEWIRYETRTAAGKATDVADNCRQGSPQMEDVCAMHDLSIRQFGATGMPTK